MKKRLVVLEIEYDDSLKQDDPAQWQYRELLDLAPNESVRAMTFHEAIADPEIREKLDREMEL